jgi:hypothetical protein
LLLLKKEKNQYIFITKIIGFWNVNFGFKLFKYSPQFSFSYSANALRVMTQKLGETKAAQTQLDTIDMLSKKNNCR